jgi:predicted glycoside hydrolase/deacetylase ChbG (UPF0249 family)
MRFHEGIVLMCHPGHNYPGLAPSTYRAEREMEPALLTHSAARKRAGDPDIELITFGTMG